MNELLRVRGLSVRYPGAASPAVRGMTFDLAATGSLGVVGESGSGKSTAALAITRLLSRDVTVEADEVTFDGEDLLGLSPKAMRSYRARRIAMVFQDPMGSWNPARTIGNQLIDGLRAADVGPEGEQRLVDLLQRVGILHPRKRLQDYPHQFSGGMLQRAMIAGALAKRPALLVADEPTSALDATVQADLLDLLAELKAEAALGLLIISHDLGVVARVAAQTMVLYAGHVVEQGTTHMLFHDPAHPYTWGLMASVPRLHTPRKVPLATVRAGPVAAAGCVFAPRCPLAVDRCWTEAPALRDVRGRLVACHRAEEVPVAVEEAS